MRKIEVTLPRRWSDLKPGQLEAVSRLFLKYRDKKELLVHCFLLFSGWRMIRWRMVQLEGSDHFLFRRKKEAAFIAGTELLIGLVKQLEWITEGFWLPSYVPPIEGFQTPNRMLYGVTLEQYLMADDDYIRFVRSGEFHHLDRMLITLYCTDFRDTDLEAASVRMARRPRHIRFAAFIWYTGAKMWMRQKYAYIYCGDHEQSQYPDEPILNILSILNGGDITRNQRILQTPVHEALFELNQKAEQVKPSKHV